MNIYKIAEQIDVVKIASDMVKIPSYSFMERQENNVANYIYEFFKSNNIDVKKVYVDEGRPNVIAKIPGKGGKSLMLSGHIDTVPPYDMVDPFSGEIENGKLHGRGSCDMKGPIAAMMVAMKTINESDVVLDGDLYFSAVIDEEEKGSGIESLIKEWPDIDAVIVGEPTQLNICLGHKGLEWIKVEITGKKVHSGNMKDGVNAINMAVRFLTYIEDVYSKEILKRKHKILGEATINIGTINGGDQPSTVPDKCVIGIDRRFVPGETKEQVYDELKEIIEKLSVIYPGFNAEVTNLFNDENFPSHLPFCTDENSDIVNSIKKAMKETGVNNKEVKAFAAWSDAGMLSEKTNSKCIVLGPGNLALAHSAHEFIETSELIEATKIYIGTAMNYCKGGKG
ncbi:MAG: M20 family metallopeptidase [Peptostreptococcaceae bacterium]|nr:M20 family metallopeptidase [Peptostreptococcaceae bacterium]